MSFVTLGMLIGGLGLFLLAVGMISDGLKMAAGTALRNLLARSTQTPLKGILSGMTITAIVQSSSAVTVATIGFVNAGLLTLYQAMGVVYGANIGTTMTGWLVAIIGFKIKVEAFALPMIGIGMMLSLVRSGTRWGYIGSALAGFGLFFIGIDVLKNAFEGIASGINLEEHAVPGVAGVLMYAGIGFLMTVLTQSSSAAIALTLTAATGGVVSLESAAAMVVGANVGTTSTAAFAVIGATPNAKRVASAHVIFNLLTGLVALMILPLLFLVIKNMGTALGLEDNPAVTLALFHTVFNILGVMLMWPLTQKVGAFLLERFKSTEEVESKPRYIDNNVAVSPSLALSAANMELKHVAEMCVEMTGIALSTRDIVDKRIEQKFSAIENLARELNSFTVDMGKQNLPDTVSQSLPKVIYAMESYRTMSELAFNYARHQVSLNHFDDEALHKAYHTYVESAATIIDQAIDIDSSELDEKQLAYHQEYHNIRALVLEAVPAQRFDVDKVGMLIDQLYRLDRMVKQVARGKRRLAEIEDATHLVTTKREDDTQTDDLSDTAY